MVQATLNLLRAAQAHPLPFDYYCLISGSDYPIRSNAYIHSYFEDHQNCEFIKILDFMHKEKSRLLPRLKYFVFERGLNRQTLFNTCLFQLNQRILSTPLFKRNYQKHLGGLKPYIGSAWWVLSDRTIRYIFDFMEKHPKIVNFYRHTAHPLEMFFHTIIGNSPFFDNVTSSVTYTDWSPHAISPTVITDKHVRDLEIHLRQTESQSEAEEFLFARKCPPDRQDLMDRIDVNLRGAHVEACSV